MSDDNPSPETIMDFMQEFGAVSMANTDPTDRLKLAIIGPPKGGKSRLACTAPRPILDYDFDDRSESIKSLPEAMKKDIYIKTLQDKEPINPTAFGIFQTDIGKMEYAVSQGKQLPFKTIIVDSVTYCSKWAMNWALGSMNEKAGAKEVSVGGFRFKLARGFEPYDAETNAIANSAIRLFNLGVHVIFVFHERAEEAPDSSQASPKFTGRFTVDPPRMSKILPLFNEQWRITPNSGLYVVQTKPNYEFIGATCLDIGETEEPNIEAMIAKHKAKKLAALEGFKEWANT